MARSFTGILVSAARASARASRRYEVEQRRQASARIRYEKAKEREYIKYEKENIKRAKQEYLELRLKEAEELTIEDKVKFIYLATGIIQETLEVDDTINFETLNPEYLPPSEKLPDKILELPVEPSEFSFVDSVGKMPIWGNLLNPIKLKWLEKVERAKNDFQIAHKNWEKNIEEKNEEIESYKLKMRKEKENYDSDYNRKVKEIEEFKSLYFLGNEEAVASYVSLVLENSEFNFDWERDYKVAFNKNSGELLVEFKLPTIEIVPNTLEYKYVRTKDIIEEKFRKKVEIDACYKSLIASIAIRTIHEVVESDQSNSIEVIIFNGFVETVDKGIGKTIFPTLLSISTSKSEFIKINLARVDPIKCLQSLSAKISSSPSELVPIKPIKEFSMVDKRYVAEEDIISTLDISPNLMELNPFEFENLVTNLFSKMGLETKQTRSSKDGGIDAVAFDLRPVLGGKIVIQAKRYKNIVGVSAVRDLYGTMINEGATKGILVTTSWYGSDAYQFSKDKPIELIDWSGLLYLLQEIGIKARIIIPSEA